MHIFGRVSHSVTVGISFEKAIFLVAKRAASGLKSGNVRRIKVGVVC
jgi:hypothetical protein